MDVLLEGGAALQQRDYTLIIDKSNSMCVSDSSDGKSRWEIVQESTLAMASQCEQFDLDGLTVYLFWDHYKRFEHVTSSKVAQIFVENEPAGKSNLAAVLKDATDNYFKRRAILTAKPNGETLVVITAGEVEDPEAVKQVIIEAANQLERDEELGISLIQAGHNPEATKFLKLLDEELKGAGAKFDICNTITLEEMEFMSLSQVLLDAIID